MNLLRARLALGPALALAAVAVAEAPDTSFRSILAAAGRGNEAIERWPPLDGPAGTAHRGRHSVYFHLERRPAGDQLTLPRLNNSLRAVTLLRQRPPGPAPRSAKTEYVRPRTLYRSADLLKLTQTPTRWMVALPPDTAIPAVVAVDVVGTPHLATEPFVVQPADDGSITLPAHHAVVHGQKLQFEPQPHKNTIGYWIHASDRAEWSFEVTKPGPYEIHVLQGCGDGQGGSNVRVDVAGESLEFEVRDTGHFQNFVWRRIGEVTIRATGVHELGVKPERLARSAVMDVRQIRLLPADATADPAPRDLADVAPDLVVPPLLDGKPRAGRRVVETSPGYEKTAVYHVLYLPTDWRPDRRYPVLVEFTGNGGYRNAFGDVCTGRVEDGKLGFGLSGGAGFIWLGLPYLNSAGTAPVTRWWGSAPDFDVRPTLDYCRKTIRRVCDRYGGDADRLVLCGFSRGAIACNYVGLHDDPTAALWRAFVLFSHYDGMNEAWPYPGSDRASALERLERLQGRPQFICVEGPRERNTFLQATEEYVRSTGVDAPFTFASSGFRNHSDAWVLRPSATRAKLRKWLDAVLTAPPRPRK